MTVVIPTLAADSALLDCLRSLDLQTFRDFEVIVVDNSGMRAARALGVRGANVRIIENASNAGFGGAINQGLRESEARWLATLNDDAEASAGWLAEIVATGDASPDIGMVASHVRLDDEHLDSAGMLIARDGSSRQRGHRQHPSNWQAADEALLPSGSAAAYRRAMMNDLGGFDQDFFLYCEDTDLGLRAAWRGWRCAYAPLAVVHHRYSHSAGRASKLKAWYVERNRVRLVLKNYPSRMLPGALFTSMVRYLWHAFYLIHGSGTAAQFRQSGGSGMLLPWYVIKAHLDAAVRLPVLWAQRRGIRRTAKISTAQFASLLRAHGISARQVAAL